uniref:RNase H type-1 domain-containing protein n=1 Tax=Strigops habroptila TaxID=2489341 RepID=A0A672TI07_STRHB
VFTTQHYDATPEGQVYYLFTDSWAVAQGLVNWLGKWQQDDYKIRMKDMWGREFWQKIWDALRTRMIQVHHVDAHMANDTETARWNDEVDRQAHIRTTTVDTGEQAGLSQWAHEKAGHAGREATWAWAAAHRILIPQMAIEQVIANCPVCQLLEQAKVFQTPLGKVKRGLRGGEVWQIDFIGPLPEHKHQRYVCVAVDIYSSTMGIK